MNEHFQATVRKNRTIENSLSIDQIEAKSVHSMYGEVVTFCHGLKLEAPVVSSKNFLNPPLKRFSEIAAAAFIETQAEALAPDTKDLPKTRRQVKRKVRKAIKDLWAVPCRRIWPRQRRMQSIQGESKGRLRAGNDLEKY